MTPAYVVFAPASVKRIRKSTEISASTATIKINANEGNTPRTFRIAGIDIIPDPIMLVATLNTAPGMVPCSAVDFDPGKRGTWIAAVGDIPAVRLLGKL
ncbi:Transmembrane amino acid transporter family protein [Trifolium repens]|nr:Transmembrane amino acid transporter family protein [Trifolium repens]